MPDLDKTPSLRDLFHRRLFRVPDFQRGYAWEASNVQDFLDDLKYLDSDRIHYTGTVVIHAAPKPQTVDDEDDVSHTPVDLVDGQQRLTTAVILLSCIQRRLRRLGRTGLADVILKSFVVTRDEADQPIYKLTLNGVSNTYFHRSVLADDYGQLTATISSETRLKLARERVERFLNDELAGLNDELSVEWLRELHKKVTDCLRFSLFEVNSEADVGIIFEVMNDRGKPLTELELVKNYLLYAGTALGVADSFAPQVNEAWSRILTRLMRANLERSQDEDRLLRAHWVTRHNPRPRDWSGIHSVKSLFDVRRDLPERKQLAGDLSHYINDLQESSIPFCDAYSPWASDAFDSFEASPSVHAQVVEWSSKLARLGTPVSMVPLLIAVRLTNPRDADKYLATLKLCEKYAFRIWTLQGARSNAGQSRLFWTAYELRNGHRSFESAIASIKSELAWRCGDQDYEEHFNKLVERGRWYGWRGLRYMLYEYEIHLATTEHHADPRLTWEQVARRDLADSIEHILPRSIESVPYWTHRFSDEDHRLYLHDIGNLTLSRFNSSLSNQPFPEKQGTQGKDRRYISSPFFQERDLYDHYEDWTPDTIVKRRERILDWARQRWSVDFSNVSDDHDEIDPDEMDDELDDDEQD